MIEIEFSPTDFFVDYDKVEDDLETFGIRAVREIRSGMRATPKTGRVYRRGGKTHVASSPDNYPAIDTGRLAGSTAFDAARTEVTIKQTMEYAAFVNDGTRRMAARPAVQLGVDATLEGWPEFLSDFIALRKSR